MDNQTQMNVPPDNFDQVQPAGMPGGDSTKPKNGLAIASMVLGIVSLVFFCCCFFVDFITVPLALIFGIISLAKKRGGTGMAITGIVLSSLCILISFAMVYSVRDILPYSDQIVADYTELMENADEIFPAYEETGQLPSFMTKYNEPPFSDFLAKYDADIYVIMDALLEQYKSGAISQIDFSGSAFVRLQFN